MLIAQISDIHIGPHFNIEAFDKAVKEINELKPNAILITGDLTENGMLPEYEKARELIGRLEADKIVLSGNHDYRNTGYLIFKRYFQQKQLYEFDDCVIATLSTARPDRDEGEVGYRQNRWLLNTLSKYTDDRVKIVAMHHHLISAPDTGSDRIIVLDAGDALHTALQANVSLVLCGHKHRPWMWKLGSLTIGFAGTVSSVRMRGFFKNSYNIVKIEKGKINIDLKVVGEEKIPLENIVKMRELVEE